MPMERCPNCGAGELKLIVATMGRPLIEKFLLRLGLDTQPLTKGRADEPRPRFAG